MRVYGHHRRVCSESWLGRKIPCHTRESNLRQWCAGLTLYQLSYISTYPAVLSTFMLQKYFSALNYSFQRCSHVSLLFINQHQGKFSSYCTLLPQILSSFMISQTQSVRHKNGSFHGHVFTIFKCQFFLQTWLKKSAVSVFFISAVLTGPMTFLLLQSFFMKK